MRMNKETHAAGTKRPADKKKDRSAKNDFRKSPFVTLKEDSERSRPKENQMKHLSRNESEQMAELIRRMLKEVFAGDVESDCATQVVGVVELDPDCRLNMEFGGSVAKHGKTKKETPSAMPPADGCGEEVFQEMLGDLNYMAKMILEADFLTKMMTDEKVDPEDARCITYLSLHEARNILKKWDAYRRCEI